MSRTRYVQISGQLVQIGGDYEIESRTAARDQGLLWNDREYQDMGDARFNSRSSHQEYMRRNGLTTTSDYKDEWRVKERQRVDAKNGVDVTRKFDVERAIRQLNSRRS